MGEIEADKLARHEGGSDSRPAHHAGHTGRREGSTDPCSLVHVCFLVV